MEAQKKPLAAKISSILLGYQCKWIADTSPVKIIEKSRRIGLSYAEAADDVLYAAGADGANVYYISYNQTMTQGFIQDCATWARAFNAAASQIQESVIEVEEKQILTYTIKFDSGHCIQAFTSNPRNLRSKGRPGERLVIDEAAFVDDIEELLKAAMAMTMWGGQIRIISTHNGADNPFNELINDVRAGKYDFSLHRVDLDNALEDGLYKRICQVTKKAWSVKGEADWRQAMINRYRPNDAEELFCVPAKGGGVYISRALIEARMDAALPVIRYTGSDEFNGWPNHLREAEIRDWCDRELLPLLKQLNPEEQHAFGEDFGRSGDLTVIAPIAISQQLQRRVPFLVELRNVPFKQQEQILFYIVSRLPRLLAGKLDARGNGQYLAEQAAYQFGSGRIEQVMLSNAWYLEHMPKFKAAFEDGELTIPKDADVLDDLRAIESIKGIPKIPDGNTSSGGGQRHGDAAVALCLAYAASCADAVEYAYEAVPKPKPGDDRDGDQVRGTFGFGRYGGGIL